MDVSGKVDDSAVQAALSQLTGELAESLARSMAVAGGRVIRDEAKARTPVESGGLRDAIYLAFQNARSSGPVAVYSVSWNKRKAPHGHLLEFGHWQTHVAYVGSDGKWYSGAPKQPKWIAAHPFLRPAVDAAGERAQAAMAARARVRLPELLAGASTEKPSEETTPFGRADPAPAGMRHAIPGAAMNLVKPEWVPK